jgi:hypothetical protein
MFTVYAVRVVAGEKHRHVLQSFERIDEAKHLANCATLGNADYAYVKDSKGGTVFFMERLPDAYSGGNFPLEKCRPVSASLS